jgi:hypothetical protein
MPPNKGGNAKKEAGRAKKADNEVRRAARGTRHTLRLALGWALVTIGGGGRVWEIMSGALDACQALIMVTWGDIWVRDSQSGRR